LIKFFRINDPYRLAGLFIILLLLRLPFLISSQTLTVPELNWMLIGEKMVDGSKIYINIVDHIGPFSAFVYWLIDLAVGRSPLTYQILGMLLVFIQATLFNFMLINNKAYNENTFVPALMYVLLACSFWDISTLSPEMMSITFVILAIANIYVRLEQKIDDPTILRTGLYLGVAMHFYFLSGFFILAIVLSLAFFTGMALRRFIMLIFGIVLVFSLSGIYFFWHDGLNDYLVDFVYGAFLFSDISYASLMELMKVAILPTIYFVFSIFMILQSARFINYQQRFQQTMLFVLLMSIVVFLFDSQRAGHLLIIFVPVFAFFITHYFLLVKRKWVRATMFWIYFLGLQIISLGSFYQWPFIKDEITFSKLKVTASPYDSLVSGKKVLMIDNDLNIYLNSEHATPYLNWQLSKLQLAEPDYYDNLSRIYQGFSTDMPQVIIDPHGVMPSLMARIPLLKQQYGKSSVGYVYEKRNP